MVVGSRGMGLIGGSMLGSVSRVFAPPCPVPGHSHRRRCGEGRRIGINSGDRGPQLKPEGIKMTTPVTPHDTITRRAGRNPRIGLPGTVAAQQPALALDIRGRDSAPVRRSCAVGHHTDITGPGSHSQLWGGAGSPAGRRCRCRLAGNHQQVSGPGRPRPSRVGDFSPCTVRERARTCVGDAISRRRTDRLAFAAPEPWVELEERLRAVLDGTAVDLDVIDDSGRPALADVSRRMRQHRRDDASTDMNCSGGQVIPTLVMVFHRPHYPRRPRVRGLMLRAISRLPER